MQNPALGMKQFHEEIQIEEFLSKLQYCINMT